MKTFYIYEVVGHKNGATNDWEKRRRENIETWGIEPIIIETMEGPNNSEFWQIVGDREWELADINGYPRGPHYRDVMERRQIGGRIGGRNTSPNGGIVGGRIAVESGRIFTMPTFESRSKGGIKGGPIGGSIAGKMRRKLTMEEAEDIRRIHKKENIKQTELAKRYQVSKKVISYIINMKSYI